MQLHNLTSPQRKRSRRIGRGGKRGTYSGRGIKGQKARAGRKLRPEWRDIIKRFPKKRGYRMSVPRRRIAEVKIGELEKVLKEGEIVSPKTLIERGILRAKGGKLPAVKLLASGKLSKQLLVKDCQISAGAKKAIEEAGGKVYEARNHESLNN